MSFGSQGGERRLARENQSCAPGAGTTNRASAQETRPSLGPETRARQSSLHIGRKLDGEALLKTSRLGKLAQAGGTNTGVCRSGRSAARRVSIAPAREAAWHVRKGRRSRPPSLRGSRARVWLLARRMYVAEVRRRRLVSNKLGKRAPKRAAGSSERGPSSKRVSAGETVGDRVERNARRSSTSPKHVGRGSERDPG
jgi:hypothetical protein